MSQKYISLETTPTQCAILYMLYIQGPIKQSEIFNKYGITKNVIKKLIARGFVEKFKDGRLKLRLTELGKTVVELNEDTCKDSYELLIACKLEHDRKSCDLARYTRLLIVVPVESPEESGEEE